MRYQAPATTPQQVKVPQQSSATPPEWGTATSTHAPVVAGPTENSSGSTRLSPAVAATAPSIASGANTPRPQALVPQSPTSTSNSTAVRVPAVAADPLPASSSSTPSSPAVAMQPAAASNCSTPSSPAQAKQLATAGSRGSSGSMTSSSAVAYHSATGNSSSLPSSPAAAKQLATASSSSTPNSPATATQLASGESNSMPSSPAVPTPPATGSSSSSTAAPKSTLIVVVEHCPVQLYRTEWSMSQFDVKSKVYEGMVSIVWRAVDKRSGITLAIKAYKRAALNDLERHQVAREIWLHAQLVHPNIISLYAAWKDPTYVYLAMEWAEQGNTFSFLHAQGGQLEERHAVKMVLEPVLSALAYLHQRGMIHRDVKPENILMTSSLQIKLADFGLSICAAYELANTRLGTVEYIAPEILDCPTKTHPEDFKDDPKAAYTDRVDCWSAGVLAYELLTGKVPFRGANIMETLRKIRYNEPQIPTEVSPGAQDFMRMALTRDPKKRASMQQLLAHPWVVSHCRQLPLTAGSSRRGDRWSAHGCSTAEADVADDVHPSTAGNSDGALPHAIHHTSNPAVGSYKPGKQLQEPVDHASLAALLPSSSIWQQKSLPAKWHMTTDAHGASQGTQETNKLVVVCAQPANVSDHTPAILRPKTAPLQTASASIDSTATCSSRPITAVQHDALITDTVTGVNILKCATSVPTVADNVLANDRPITAAKQPEYAHIHPMKLSMPVSATTNPIEHSQLLPTQPDARSQSNIQKAVAATSQNAVKQLPYSVPPQLATATVAVASSTDPRTGSKELATAATSQAYLGAGSTQLATATSAAASQTETRSPRPIMLPPRSPTSARSPKLKEAGSIVLSKLTDMPAGVTTMNSKSDNQSGTA